MSRRTVHDQATDRPGGGHRQPLVLQHPDERLSVTDFAYDPQRPIIRRMIERGAVVVNSIDQAQALGIIFQPGTDTSLSAVFVPVKVGDRLIAYNRADVVNLEKLMEWGYPKLRAAAMGVEC